MKTKWLWYDILFCFIALAMLFGIVALVIFVMHEAVRYKWDEMILAVQYIIKGTAYLIIGLCIFAAIRDLIKIRVLKFDEKGFYFYDIKGLRCFCAWSEITKAEYFKTKNVINDSNRHFRPICIAVYTDKHFIEPDLDENLVLRNFNRNGRKYKINKDGNSLALIMGMESFSGYYFKKYFNYYRPDLAIMRDESMLES